MEVVAWLVADVGQSGPVVADRACIGFVVDAVAEAALGVNVAAAVAADVVGLLAFEVDPLLDRAAAVVA